MKSSNYNSQFSLVHQIWFLYLYAMTLFVFFFCPFSLIAVFDVAGTGEKRFEEFSRLNFLFLTSIQSNLLVRTIKHIRSINMLWWRSTFLPHLSWSNNCDHFSRTKIKRTKTCRFNWAELLKRLKSKAHDSTKE